LDGLHGNGINWVRLFQFSGVFAVGFPYTSQADISSPVVLKMLCLLSTPWFSLQIIDEPAELGEIGKPREFFVRTVCVLVFLLLILFITLGNFG